MDENASRARSKINQCPADSLQKQVEQGSRLAKMADFRGAATLSAT